MACHQLVSSFGKFDEDMGASVSVAGDSSFACDRFLDLKEVKDASYFF